MKTKVMKAMIAGFVGVAAVGLIGCSDAEPVATAAPVRIVHEPTALTTVPASANSTTVATQYSNGTVVQRTTTDYNPSYTTVGPPYKTTIVPAEPTTTTTRTTVTDE